MRQADPAHAPRPTFLDEHIPYDGMHVEMLVAVGVIERQPKPLTAVELADHLALDRRPQITGKPVP